MIMRSKGVEINDKNDYQRNKRNMEHRSGQISKRNLKNKQRTLYIKTNEQLLNTNDIMHKIESTCIEHMTKY